MDMPGIKKLATGEAETGIYCMRKKSPLSIRRKIIKINKWIVSHRKEYQYSITH